MYFKFDTFDAWKTATNYQGVIMSFEIGDRVWDVRFGPGVVTNVCTSGSHPVRVDFNCCLDKSYLANGKDKYGDINPSLYHHGTKLIPAPEPVRCPFKKYDRVLMRDNSSQLWQIAIFKEFYPGNTYPYSVYTNTPYQYGGAVRFRFCVPFEGNEHLIGTNGEVES